MLDRRSRPNDSFPKLFGGSLYCKKSAFGKDYYCAKEPFGANLYLDGRAEMIATVWDDTDYRSGKGLSIGSKTGKNPL
jgi:hypothetical protein